MVAQSVESLALDQRARVRGSPGKKPSCILMAPGAWKIRRGCNVLQVPIQNYTSGHTKAGEPSPPGLIKIAMACIRIILRDEGQTVGNSSLA